MSFAGRLVSGVGIILALTLLILVIAAERSLRHDLESDTIRTLEREARLVREALPADSNAWQATVTRLAIQTGSRITIIDGTGRVRADSDIPTDSLSFLQNHAHRPEVRTALAGHTGTDVRSSVSVGRPLTYLAIPGGPGVIRLAANRNPLGQIVRRARGAMAGAALLALTIGVLAALAVARSISRPLLAIGSAARDISGGVTPRFPASNVPEIRDLVSSLRQMDRQLTERFAALKREQSESASLIDAMIEGVLAVDEQGHIITANGAARRLLGFSDESTLPDLAELFRSPPGRQLAGAILTGQPARGRQLEFGGRTLLVNGRPFEQGGAVLVLHDLTELRRLEAVRRDFVANVSHELKTPLTSITGYAETLLEAPPDGTTAERFLRTILTNAHRMQRLVDDLLDLARIETGHWQPAPAGVNPVEIAAECQAEFTDRANARGVSLTIEALPGTEQMQTDPAALRQILTNLLDNALRYTPAGGIVECRIEREPAAITVIVADSGAGIAEEHLPRIFERFYRVDPGRSREEGGTGLGLAIVKHLVEAQGGQVDVVSSLGQGTTIICRFPA